ncbi:MAG TPA: TetR/AcrR family transcriptional regulator [Marmoricola sp.]|nr:TetR/AcrR family transcriptional regulator [Marmoricola sp.]HNJ77737.1 TetR/AcrR family transcriptional regulator [Marmoricola sp.]
MRNEQMLARRQQMIDAVFTLIDRGSFGDVTLQGVADQAGVSLKTVTRHFGTKEELLRQAMAEARVAEEDSRKVPVGDLDAVVEVLGERYELMAEAIYRMSDMELSYTWLSEWVQMARRSHLDWLADAFEPWLPRRGREREDRLMCLFSATEIRSWWAIRQRFGYSPERARSVMRRQLEALTSQWEIQAEGKGKP